MASASWLWAPLRYCGWSQWSCVESFWFDGSKVSKVLPQLIPNVALYENCTCIDGDHIELADERKLFLEGRGHKLEARAAGAIVQLVIQSLQNTPDSGHKSCKGLNSGVVRGTLTDVSDPRKDGRPAAV
ncbi:hypothetical protein NL676_031797 [Syzygium grande]|nr:hypothetical protein NL676_031797 [Syzygium grande]